MFKLFRSVNGTGFAPVSLFSVNRALAVLNSSFLCCIFSLLVPGFPHVNFSVYLQNGTHNSISSSA